ncbi:ATP-binding protein [Nonomuraea basaltis]|uniref:ATP-binding protein n=1 Tax=Nonomuraea basaltis TaxID=2495887 RepID=UPI00110C5972|nr:ATP-binding protein [Nonomuraea basaltis]TMR98709.1 ATP-binding protein [Nonomuraea basaltis]
MPDVVVWRSTTLRRNDRTPWQARQATGLWLADSHPSVRADALQIVAELVANVIQHVPAGRRRDWLKVRLGFGDGFARLEVIDPGTPKPEPSFAPRRVGPMEESGRGLGIVARLSIRCGTHVIKDGHRVVWADIAVSA